ncbi:MAG: hypothetical protein HKP55_09450 [Gammaproteobacteria bacterium]|nr:hypothetical protein [Gammaproteobacteria bacterium]
MNLISAALNTSSAPFYLTNSVSQDTGSKPGQLDDLKQALTSNKADEPYTEEELALIAELKRRDREVRAHEQAHRAAAGPYASAPTFTYQKGPDGKNYAVGGEVQIDTSPIPGDPEATKRKADQIRAAANAPASPSAQDRAVAADAASMAIKAQMEIASQRREENSQTIDNTANNKLPNYLPDDQNPVLLDVTI